MFAATTSISIFVLHIRNLTTDLSMPRVGNPHLGLLYSHISSCIFSWPEVYPGFRHCNIHVMQKRIHQNPSLQQNTFAQPSHHTNFRFCRMRIQRALWINWWAHLVVLQVPQTWQKQPRLGLCGTWSMISKPLSHCLLKTATPTNMSKPVVQTRCPWIPSPEVRFGSSRIS